MRSTRAQRTRRDGRNEVRPNITTSARSLPQKTHCHGADLFRQYAQRARWPKKEPAERTRVRWSRGRPAARRARVCEKNRRAGPDWPDGHAMADFIAKPRFHEAISHGRSWNATGWTVGQQGTAFSADSVARQRARAYNASCGNLTGRRTSLQLDDHLKRLLRELGHAINDTVSESDRITEAISGRSRRGLRHCAEAGRHHWPGAPRIAISADHVERPALPRVAAHPGGSRSARRRERSEAKLEITPQDVRFLKSLKISFDDRMTRRLVTARGCRGVLAAGSCAGPSTER